MLAWHFVFKTNGYRLIFVFELVLIVCALVFDFDVQRPFIYKCLAYFGMGNIAILHTS